MVNFHLKWDELLISRLAQSVERSANNAEVPGGTSHGLMVQYCSRDKSEPSVIASYQVGRNPPPPPVQKRPREQDADDELERLRVICKALEDHYEYLEKEVKKWRDLYRKGLEAVEAYWNAKSPKHPGLLSNWKVSPTTNHRDQFFIAPIPDTAVQDSSVVSKEKSAVVMQKNLNNILVLRVNLKFIMSPHPKLPVLRKTRIVLKICLVWHRLNLRKEHPQVNGCCVMSVQPSLG
ncbi:hypothetical protein MIR68_008450 [Amoeboaphelidium protococcarum]|nr:hypothetical protein MIR68_008450 [Amoeboaphelidium protococcarum]